MMCWNWIDSSRKREALTISCPGPGHTVPSAVHGRAWTKNRENNPMQSRVNPGSQHSCRAAMAQPRRVYLSYQLPLISDHIPHPTYARSIVRRRTGIADGWFELIKLISHHKPIETPRLGEERQVAHSIDEALSFEIERRVAQDTISGNFAEFGEQLVHHRVLPAGH